MLYLRRRVLWNVNINNLFAFWRLIVWNRRSAPLHHKLDTVAYIVLLCTIYWTRLAFRWSKCAFLLFYFQVRQLWVVNEDRIDSFVPRGCRLVFFLKIYQGFVEHIYFRVVIRFGSQIFFILQKFNRGNCFKTIVTFIFDTSLRFRLLCFRDILFFILIKLVQMWNATPWLARLSTNSRIWCFSYWEFFRLLVYKVA